VKPDLLVIFGPSPYPPDVVMDRLLDVVEAAGGQLGHWYGEVVLDAYETGSDSFSVVRERDNLTSRDDLRARIRRNGSGQASYWSGKMLSGSEYALVFEDPPPASPDDLASVEQQLLQAFARGEPGAVAVYADWLESSGSPERAELLRLRDEALSREPSASAHATRLRALVRSADAHWLARIHACTTTILHLAAATSDPWSSGVARFVAADPAFADFRRETLAGFEAMAIAIDATHFLAGEDLFHWRLLDADRFLAGPVPELHPRHVAWRRDAFESSQIGVWGKLTPSMIEHGRAFDHVELW
jgi:uncharacterized protein (TIGR02996 family)